MNPDIDDDENDLTRYQVHSRREILNLLRTVGTRNQLVRIQANNGADAAVTSILEVDDASDTLILDCAPSALTNQRILESDEIAFETVLENIRILFFASHMDSCVYEGRPAFSMALPDHLIRLQRREFYRVSAPAANPVLCYIPISGENGEAPSTATVSLYNVSGGGISVVDEQKLIPPTHRTRYKKCRIDLPGGAVEVTLELMNLHDHKLSNGKTLRRIGFMFVDISNATTAAIQRYITKLEREQNARANGMG